MRQIRDEAYDVLLTDLRLPDLGGAGRIFRRLKTSRICKADRSFNRSYHHYWYASIYTIKQAMRAGAYDFLLNLRNRWMLYKLLRMQSANAHWNAIDLPLKWSRYKQNIKNWVHVKRKCKAKRSRVLYKHSASLARFLNMSQL